MEKAKQSENKLVEQLEFNKYIIPESSYIMAKHSPTMTKQWNNGIYNFNSNFIKNIPSADMAVSKMIKNFFTINPLSYNRYGKKSRLLNRRYKRLSLNRILASQPEVKHDNNKVNITVYLFNKKKISLLRALNSKKNDLNIGRKAVPSYNIFPSNTGLISKLGSKIVSKKTLSGKLSKPFAYLNTKLAVNNSTTIDFSALGFPAKKKVLKNKKSLFNKWLFNKKFIFSKKSYYAFLKNRRNNRRNKKFDIYNHKFISKAKNRFNSYNKSIYLTKNALSKYIFSSNIDTNKSIMFKSVYGNKSAHHNETALKQNIKMLPIIQKGVLPKYTTKNILVNYYDVSNKYKLLNNFSNVESAFNNTNSTILFTNNIKTNNKSNSSLSRKINNLHIVLLRNTSDTLDILTKSKLNIRSIFKRIPVKSSKKYRLTSSIRKLDNNILKTIYPGKVMKDTNKIYLTSALATLNKAISRTIYRKPSWMKKNKIAYQHSVIMRYNLFLMKKINRIENFIKRYNKVLLLGFAANDNNKNNNISNITVNNINNLYKSMYIKDILHKETMYLHYMKLLSYNDALFKSWLLAPLKDIISKVYNKKVVLNLVNLKYLHLNSDILIQAMAIRLRNIKKNKLNKVLRKTLSLVKISKINSFINDIHHPVYKYIEQHFDKFKYLNASIFNDVVTNNNKIESSKSLYGSYNPISTKWLNHIQTNTINFIKYKSVFGLKLEASGRLTKRSTASRSIFKFRYKGGLKNNPDITRNNSTTLIKSNRISNLQFSKISSKTRNGSFGLKSWINNN